MRDHGVKCGNIQLPGVASCAAPILSTLILILTGIAELSTTLLVSAARVASGAWIAART